MGIRYRLITSMIGAILLVVLPLSFLFLREQERRIVAAVLQEGGMLSRILAFSARTVLLMNAGDIDASGIAAGMLMLGRMRIKVWCTRMLYFSRRRAPEEECFGSRVLSIVLKRAGFPVRGSKALRKRGGREPDSGRVSGNCFGGETLRRRSLRAGRVAYSRNTARRYAISVSRSSGSL